MRQTGRDITVTATSGGAALFSARAFAAAQYAQLLKEFELPPAASGSSPLMFVQHKFRFMSLTGPLLAFRDEAFVDVKANAIPAGRSRFWTIDLRKGASYGFGDDPLTTSDKAPGALADLLSFFPDRAIASAAARTQLGRAARSKPGQSLLYVLSDLAQIGRKAPNCFLPLPDTTGSFALASEEPSRVSVDLGLSGQSNCRTNLTVLHLDLPRSALLRPLGPQLSAPAALPTITVEIGTPPKP